MTKLTTKSIQFFVLFFLCSQGLSAQNLLFNEAFNGGLGTFTAGAGTPVGAIWEHSSTGTAATSGNGLTSALFWGTLGAIQSPTVSNGCAMFNSDVYDGGGIAVGSGAFPGAHSGDLTSPSINLVGQNSVSLKFNQFARAYLTTVATLLDVSIDNGVTWTNIPINPTIISNNLTTENDVQLIDISTIAGNQPNVKIRFTWSGEYYFWLIDDVQIIATPDNNLLVTNYNYPPASYELPITQANGDTFEFSFNISNIGGVAQTNVKAYAEIIDTGFNSVWIDSTVIAIIPPNTTDSNITFTSFVPNQLVVGLYAVRYSTSSDSVDFDFSDNEALLPFEITDSSYQMNQNITSALRPSGGGDYMLGNVYKTSPTIQLGDYEATTANFSVAKNAADGPLAGDAVALFLLEVSNNVASDWSNFNTSLDMNINPDLSLVGFASYTFGASAGNYDVFTVPLQDFATIGYGVPLKPNTRYLLVLDLSSTANVIFTAIDNSINRDQVSTILFSGNSWFTGGFGSESSAVVNMNIGYTGTGTVSSFEFENTTMTVNESDGNAAVNVEINSPNLTTATSVDVVIDANNTTATSADFTLNSPTTVNFPAGVGGSYQLNIPILLDAVPDGGEVIQLKLVNPSTNTAIGVDSIITITINDSPPSPVMANSDSVAVVFNTITSFSALTNDSIPYSVTSYSVISQPTKGAVTLNNPIGIYTPTMDSCGLDSFQYSVCNNFTCDTATVYFTISCAISLDAIGENLTVLFNDSLIFNPTLNDSLPYGFSTINIIQNPTLGTLTVMGGSFNYQTNPNSCGTDVIIYEICDNYNCDTASIILNIACPTYSLRSIADVTGTDGNGVATSLNGYFEINGTVHSIDYRGGNGYSFYLIDATGGINVFSPADVDSYTVNQGDLLQIKGQIIQFNGLTEIIPHQIAVNGTQALNTPTIVTVLDESTESELVKIETMKLADPTQWTNAGSGFNVDITDGILTFVMRIDNDCDLYGQPAPTSWFNVTGLGTQFDSSNPYTSGYQILPRSQADLETIIGTEIVDFENEIQLFPNPAHDVLYIKTGVSLVNIKITNVLGQNVKTINQPNSSVSIPLNGWAKGVYTITFETENAVWSRQFVKE